MSHNKTAPDNQDTAGCEVNGHVAAAGGGFARGNPFNRRVAEMRRAALEAVTTEDIKEILRQVVIKARNGDLTAAKLALGYSIGKPAKTVEPDRLDAEEWKLLAERPTAEEVTRVKQAGLPGLLSNFCVLCQDHATTEHLLRKAEEKAAANGVLTDGKGQARNGDKKKPVDSSEVSIVASRRNMPEGHDVDRSDGV